MDNWDDNLDDNLNEGDEVSDFSFGGKDAILFLIDAGEKMRQSDGDGDDLAPFQTALKAAQATIKKKVDLDSLSLIIMPYIEFSQFTTSRFSSSIFTYIFHKLYLPFCPVFALVSFAQ